MQQVLLISSSSIIISKLRRARAVVVEHVVVKPGVELGEKNVSMISNGEAISSQLEKRGEQNFEFSDNDEQSVNRVVEDVSNMLKMKLQ